jgi:DNA invertase Pin-like site-specific DNA recombinase
MRYQPAVGKSPRMTKEQKAEVRSMFAAGMHINDIHRATGWCFGTLKRFMK